MGGRRRAVLVRYHRECPRRAHRGPISLRIVLDCAALDAQALYVVTVATFPAPAFHRILGVLIGVSVITAANLGRIVGLYFVGVRWPSSFHVLHEEVLQFVMVLVAAGMFAVWAWRTKTLARRKALHATS